MGVNGLPLYLKTYFPQFQKTIPSDYETDHLYIDINNILHVIVRKRPVTIDIIPMIRDKIIQILKVSKPRKSVFLSIDGPGPYSKIVKQRERRYEYLNIPENTFNNLLFTPGTEYMSVLKKRLSKLCTDLSANFNIDFYLSGSDSYGEGEFKIFQHINNHEESDSLFSVYGNDSDMVLFGLLSNKKRINILSFENSDSVRDIDHLKQLISEMSKRQDKIQMYYDFVFLQILKGNDLIPGLRNYNFNDIWKIYCECAGGVEDGIFDYRNNSINWNYFLSIIKNLVQVQTEPPIFQSRNAEQIQLQFMDKVFGPINQSPISKFQLLKQLVDCDYFKNVITPNLPSDILRDYIYQLEDFINSLNPPTSNTIESYFNGVLWVMNYLRGNCTDFQYMYPNYLGPEIQYLSKFNLMNFKYNPEKLDPLLPLYFNITLSHIKGKRFFSEKFYKLFDSDLHFKQLQGSDKNSINKLKDTITEYIKNIELTRQEKDQLNFHPTLYFNKLESSSLKKEFL
eukprot:gene3696-4605_t